MPARTVPLFRFGTTRAYCLRPYDCSNNGIFLSRLYFCHQSKVEMTEVSRITSILFTSIPQGLGIVTQRALSGGADRRARGGCWGPGARLVQDQQTLFAAVRWDRRLPAGPCVPAGSRRSL